MCVLGVCFWMKWNWMPPRFLPFFANRHHVVSCRALYIQFRSLFSCLQSNKRIVLAHIITHITHMRSGSVSCLWWIQKKKEQCESRSRPIPLNMAIHMFFFSCFSSIIRCEWEKTPTSTGRRTHRHNAQQQQRPQATCMVCDLKLKQKTKKKYMSTKCQSAVFTFRMRMSLHIWPHKQQSTGQSQWARELIWK